MTVKMFCVVMSLCFGSLVALDDKPPQEQPIRVFTGDNFVAMDSGESRAWLYAATEHEIKQLFVRAVKERWSEEQFAVACAQLVGQQHALGLPIVSNNEFILDVLVGVFSTMMIMGALGFVYWLFGDATEDDQLYDVKKSGGLAKELARIRTSIEYQGDRTRAAVNRIGRHVGFNAELEAPSVISGESSFSRKRRGE